MIYKKILPVLAISFLLTGLTSSRTYGQTYCSPTFISTSGNTCTNYRLRNVQFGGINNSPAASTCAVSNYLSMTATVTAGVATPYSIQLGNWMSFGIYADFNNDGDFNDANEYLAGANSPQVVAIETVTGSVTIPTSIPAGNYRMRIVGKWTDVNNGVPAIGAGQACNSFMLAGSGNFHDYTLTVVNAATYCFPTFTSTSGNTCTNYRLRNVQLGGINNSPPASTCSVSNYLSLTANVTAGVASPFSIQLGNWMSYGIYADFNNDGDFNDANEFLAGANTPQLVAIETVTGSVTIPASIPAGNYRMRIVGKWTDVNNGVPAIGAGQACNTFIIAGSGNFHDYTLHVNTSVITCATPTAPSATSITPTSAVLNWTQSGTPPQWQIKYGVTGFNPATAGTSVFTPVKPYTLNPPLNPSTVYDYYVRAVCGANDTSAWSAVTTFTTTCTAPSILTKTDSARCGAGIVTLNATTMATGSIKWYANATGGTALATGNSFTTPSLSSTTTYYAAAVSGNCESSPRTAVVATINANPVATITPSGTVNICQGTTTTFAAGGGGNYQWRDASGNITGATTGTYTTGAAGTYRVIATTPATGCKDTSAIVTVNINPLPTVFIGNDTTFCSGNTLILNAGNAGATYLWDNAATTANRSVTTTGTYYVKVTNSNNCSARDTIKVTVNPTPIVNVGNDTAICHGQTLTLNAGNTGSSYLWNTGSTSQTITVNTTGNYSVTVTSPLLCSAGDNINVLVKDLPAGVISAIHGNPATYTFKILDAQFVAGYTWNFGDGSQPATGPLVQHTYTHNGIYTVSVNLSGDCSDNTVHSRTVDVYDAGTTGINQPQDNKELHLYPNPAKNQLILENNKDFSMKQIAVYNIIGQMMFTVTADSPDKHTLNTSSLTSGVYTLRIDTDKGLIIRKIEISK